MYSNEHIYNIEGVNDIILDYKKHFEWSDIFETYQDWDNISTMDLPLDFIEYYKNEINWNIRCVTANMSTEEIVSLREYVNFDLISIYQKLDNYIIERFSLYLNWRSMSYSQKLTGEQIVVNRDKLNWKYICEKQVLDEYTIKFCDYLVHWDLISKYQKLSEDFIMFYREEVYWYNIIIYQTHIPDSFYLDMKINKELRPVYLLWKQFYNVRKQINK